MFWADQKLEILSMDSLMNKWVSQIKKKEIEW